MDKVYIIGHKSPDLDSVTSAINYAKFKNKLENTDKYVPAVAGELNKVTEFVLDKFQTDKPEKLEDISGKKVILVDHNESSQSQDGIEEAEIVEILDHHKMDFKYGDPIKIDIRPMGSTNSIVYQMYKENNIEIDKNLAGVMLSAVLDDTVITKSPTCTDVDKEIILELSKLAEVKDWNAYGIEMFKVKSSMKDNTAMEVIKNDFKDFDFSVGKFGIGQVETADLTEFTEREDELMEEINKLKESEGYHSVVLFITDIMKEGSQFLIVTSDIENIEKALGEKLEGGKVYIDGIISRKKQVAPKFDEVFNK